MKRNNGKNKPKDKQMSATIEADRPGTELELKPKKTRGYGHGKPDVKQTMVGGINDAIFFNRNKQLSIDTTNLPFSFKNGLVSRGPTETDGTISVTTNFHVPSVICYNFDMLLGGNNAKNSLNTVANNLYSYVRYVNSGSRNYESPDLFMYFGAVSGAYGLAAFIAKCIGLTNVASPINRAYPRQVFQAMGVDFNDAIHNIANYRTRLNSCIIRLNAYNVPAKFYCYLEHIWCASILYIESENGKDQIYTSRPLSVLEFDGTSSTTGSILKFNDLSSCLTVGDYLLKLETLILGLETDEDIGIISGDVLKAMGADQCFHMGTVDENYVALPKYSKEMLLKLKNVRIPVAMATSSTTSISLTPYAHELSTPSGWLPAASSGTAVYWQIAPASSAAQIQFSFGLGTTNSTLWDAERFDSLSHGLVDTDTDNPTIDEINENMCFRFVYGAGFGNANFSGKAIAVAGLAFFRSVSLVRYSDTSLDWIVNDHLSTVMACDASSAGSQLYAMAVLHDLVTFDFIHARLLEFNNSGATPALVRDKWVGEYTNVHILTFDEVANIIDAQLLSEYAVPATEHLGKAATYAK